MRDAEVIAAADEQGIAMVPHRLPPFPSLIRDTPMKILVIGSGGREHALAWKLSRSPRVQKVLVAPATGTAREPGIENVAVTAIPAHPNRPSRAGSLTVVGPEARWPPAWWMPSAPPGC